MKRAKGEGQRLLAIKKYAELETQELSEVIEHWIDFERHQLADEPARHENLQLLLNTLSGIKKNLNKKLALERLFLGLR